jgi:hypothetical protein
MLQLLITTAVITFVVAAFLLWRKRPRSPQRVQTAEEFFAELTRVSTGFCWLASGFLVNCVSFSRITKKSSKEDLKWNLTLL